MATTMSSKTKVAFCQTTGENIVETQKKIKTTLEELHSVANSAKYAAVDRVHNCIAELSNEFGEVLDKNKKTLVEILEGLVKRTDVGEAFVASAKKALAEVESIPKTETFELIRAERDGEEVWDSSMQSKTADAIFAWTAVRKVWIENLADSFKKIEDDVFRDAVKPIGKSNEEFTNSIVANVNKIEDALTELGINIDKFIGSVSDTASSTGIGSANVKVDLQGADI